MKNFNKNIYAVGTIHNDSIKLENVKCELKFNVIKENIIEAKIYSISNFVKLHEILNGDSRISFYSNPNYDSIKFDLVTYSFNSGSAKEDTLYVKISNLETIQTFSDNKITRLLLSFNLPELPIFSRRSYLNKHASKGLLYGWGDPLLNKKGWFEDVITIDAKYGVLKIYPSFEFETLQEYEGMFNCELVLKKLNLDYKSNDLSEGIDLEIKNIITDVEEFLKIISFIEGCFVERHYLKVYAFDLGDSVVQEREYVRRIKERQIINYDIIYYNKFKVKILQSLPLLLKSKYNLNVGVNSEFEKILKRLITSLTIKAVDTRIIYMLSVLDMINLWSKSKGKGLSQKLQYSCETNNIELIDLFPYMNKNSVLNEKQDLLLNKVRNNIIHNGVYPNSYEEIDEEILASRALAERFLLKMLGIDYRNSGLGYKRKK